MLTNIFEDAVSSSAKVFGRNTDVSVIFAGTEAKTDGKVIYLPKLPDNTEITDNQADILRGFRDHESMHNRCTDMAATNRLNEATQRSKFLGMIMQLTEDCRIENAGIRLYPGMERTLGAMNDEIANSVRKNVEEMANSTGLDPAQVISTVVSKHKQFLIAYASECRKAIGAGGVLDDIVQHMDPKVVELARKWAARAAQLETGVKGFGQINRKLSKAQTNKALDLAEEIAKSFIEEMNRPPEPPTDGSDDTGDEGGNDTHVGPGKPSRTRSKEDPAGGGNKPDGRGEGGDQDDDCSGTDKGDAEGKGDGGGEGQEGSGGESEGDQPDHGGQEGGQEGGQDDAGDGRGDGGGSGGGNQDAGDGEEDGPMPGGSGSGSTSDGGLVTIGDGQEPDDLSLPDGSAAVEQTVQDVLNRASDGGNTGRMPWLTPGIKEAQVIRSFEEVFEWIAQSPQIREDGLTLVKSLTANSAAMIRRLLEIELQARADRQMVTGMRSGRLNTSQLVAAARGHEAVFKKREDGKEMDTLLFISIDGSSSMAAGFKRSDGQVVAITQEAHALAYALAVAMERTGCDTVVETWLGEAPRRAAVNRARDIVYNQRDVPWASLGITNIVVVKGLRERVTDPNVGYRFGMAQHLADGGTPMVDAVINQMNRIIKMPHKRKVFLILGDGLPHRAVNGGMERVVKTLKEDLPKVARNHGVEMIGVGIGTDMGHLFPTSISVSNDSMYSDVIRFLVKAIFQEQRHVRKVA